MGKKKRDGGGWGGGWTARRWGERWWRRAKGWVKGKEVVGKDPIRIVNVREQSQFDSIVINVDFFFFFFLNQLTVDDR